MGLLRLATHSRPATQQRLSDSVLVVTHLVSDRLQATTLTVVDNEASVGHGIKCLRLSFFSK